MSKTRGMLFGLAISCVIVCLAVLVTSSMAVTTTIEPLSAFASVAETPTHSFASMQRDRGPVRMVRFILFDEGIFPRELRVEPGLINLAIEDKTSNTSGLVIERVTDSQLARVGEVRRVSNHWRGRELIKLIPGRYQVYDASRPGNRAELIVEQ